ncbi:hypothetical protein Tco_1517192 [Tanacetum coccineum]
METIHVKFDELTTMASEHDCLEPEFQRFNNHNSSAESMNTPSNEDLDNLFGPMFEEYFEKTSSDTTINSAAQPTQVHEDSSSTSSIFVDAHEAPSVIHKLTRIDPERIKTTTMASEHDCLEPELQRFINHNSSAETMNTPSKEDLDNLLGPMFEEYFKKKFSDTTINFAAQPTQFHEDSPSTSSIIIDEHEAPPIVTTSDEQTSLISLTEADEFNQEDSADFDGNSQFVLYNPPSHEEIESSVMALEPSNVQNFHQV